MSDTAGMIRASSWRLPVLSVHASLLNAPDGTTKNAPTWPAAWYTGEAPAGTHDIVMLSDITVPYSPSTCDPSTYSTSIKGKVLLDTDGYGGESPLSSPASTPRQESLLQSFKPCKSSRTLVRWQSFL